MSSLFQDNQSPELKPESPFIKSTHPHMANPRWIKYVIISTIIACFCAMLVAIL